jgi:hypothetical protein
MGMDLIGHGDARFSAAAWCDLLDLAFAFGWQPAGTTAPPDHEGPWCGTYCSNDYQAVSDRDAHAIAEALDRAIESLRPVTAKQRRARANEKDVLELEDRKPIERLTAKQRKAWASEHISVFAVFRLTRYAGEGGFLIG